MANSVVRIESVEINNFKNVVHGVIDFINDRKPYKASILGLYGQNGSGKTALIDSLSLLKYALSGQPLPVHFADYIYVDSDEARLKYKISVKSKHPKAEYAVYYEFKIKKQIDDAVQNAEPNVGDAVGYKTIMFDEVLSYSCCGEEMSFKMQPIIDTRCTDVFVPTTKYNLLIGKDREIATNLLVAKKYTQTTSRSFIFSREFINEFRKNCDDKCHLLLIESLVRFGNFELFIIDTAKSGLITLNALPLTFKYKEPGKASVGSLMINLDDSTLVPKEALTLVKKVIANMNIVLTQLIPGLTISVKDLGNELFPNGAAGSKIQLMSHKNSQEIPLKYESEGIKKIVAVLQLLIVVYNETSITVAIDELDSGVFEYLLGELLRIISEKGTGQLIFTSHNLRPLETLDRGFIAFTTTNPANRYLRLTNVKTNNNLRDFYYRDIVLGEQSEPVYEMTNNYEIALAFKEAGGSYGS